MAKQHGFVRDTLEKVLRLKEILMYLNADEYLHEHLVLKGRTAINMTIFNLPRLSIDLDLDFTSNLCLEDMEDKLVRKGKCNVKKNSLLSSGNSRNSSFTNSQNHFTNFENPQIFVRKFGVKSLYQTKSGK